MACENMVKIKLSPSKKRYLNGKHIYDYVRGHLPIPKKFLIRLKPYLEEDFQADMSEDSTKIALTYTFFKKKGKEQKPIIEPQRNIPPQKL
jgi:hypothetical protein